MKKIISIVFVFTSIQFAFAGNGESTCTCPVDGRTSTSKIDTTFQLTDGNSIVLCGKKDDKILLGRTLFSGFVLSSCSQDSAINYWDDLDPCVVSAIKDTLQVEKLVYLPTGNGFRYRMTTWTIEKIYFSKNKVKQKLYLSKNIRKYNAQEIQTVLSDFEMADGEIDGTSITLAGKLFVSTISGNETARNYFSKFENKFGTLDGAFAEEYNHLKGMLQLWDSH
jgi:hypothetical protein